MAKTVAPNHSEDVSSNRSDSADRSLRANGETYLDRESETEKIYSRLMQSSASVIGIAGQRGAGKSSLALALLDRAKEDGAYTQLIHLPTVNNPREFLISIFQRVCEEVVSRIDEELGHERSLKEIALTAIGGYVRQRRVIQTLLVVLFALPFLYFQIQQFVQALIGDLNGANGDGLDFMRPQILVFLIALMVVIVLGVFLSRRYLRVNRQIRITRDKPSLVGLRHYAMELMEHLEYQTTLSSNQEAGIQLPNVAAKLSSGKLLAARPLSLPGISTQFTQFLDYVVASVESRKSVVICLDELDKIENPRDLDKLLRGIKGVLGHPDTHFLLTVSEDALARYVKQRRLEKGILESAFEEIVPLKPICPRVARHVVSCVCAIDEKENSKDVVSIRIALFWLFGGGIPREIKRNVLTCLEVGLDPHGSTAIEIWERLLRSRLNEMRMWASNIGTNDEITYKFLCSLQDSEEMLEQVNRGAKLDLDWAREFAKLWKKDFGLDDLVAVAQKTNGKEKIQDSEVAHAGAAVDILLGSSALAYVLEQGSKMSDETIRQLRNIFEIRTFNIAFSGRALEEYLKKIGVSK